MKQWWSASCKIICLVNQKPGEIGGMQSTHLIRAEDYDDAFEKAIAVGKSLEESYVGGSGGSVDWKFTEIVTLDRIGDELVDGVEVYSQPASVDPDNFVLSDPWESSPINCLG